MKLNSKIIFAILICIPLITIIIYSIFRINNEEDCVFEVKSPIEFVMSNNEIFKLKNFDTFDSDYTEHNKELSKKLEISEDEAFILGNFGKYQTKNILEGRRVKRFENNLIYYKFDYQTRLKNSAFCIINGIPANKYKFDKELKNIRRGNFVILDLDTDKFYPVSNENRKKVKNFVVVRKNHVKYAQPITSEPTVNNRFNSVLKSENIKIILSDFTTKLKPDRNCSSDICKEILKNINNSKNSIDMAIYGYSSTPLIEQALLNAKSRGVKIRIVYDIDSKGNNIYPDTYKLVKHFENSMSDKNSKEVKNTMHNKFYIFDNKIVITGSANLSHTDMSGYNSNSIIVIDSDEIAQIFTNEFEQMFSGKFHNDKSSFGNKKFKDIQVYFSPQDKGLLNGVLPLIKNAKQYIYIPAFVITEKRVTQELINAKKRGIDVKIILDSLNASTQHSKHKELRNAGILLKAENYAGKMHSKSMIIDDKYLIIGSMNFSNSGENRNDENMIIINNPESAKFYKQFFLYQWNKIPDKWLKYTPRAEGIDSIGSCTDGLDNNYDGYTDIEDEACKG